MASHRAYTHYLDKIDIQDDIVIETMDSTRPVVATLDLSLSTSEVCVAGHTLTPA